MLYAGHCPFLMWFIFKQIGNGTAESVAYPYKHIDIKASDRAIEITI